MATETFSAQVGQVRAISTAGGGTALASTVTAGKTLGFPSGTRYLMLMPRNFATAVVAQIALNPWLSVFKSTSVTAITASTITDGSEALQDNATGTTLVLDSLDTFANGNAIYIGAHDQFRGVDIDVGNTNSTASVLTVKYWDGSAWSDITATDGTASGGATFAQDGLVTWTVPSGWTTTSLVSAGDAASTTNFTLAREKLYWTRWEVSVALDASVTLQSMHALNKSTAYMELLAGQIFETSIRRGGGLQGIGAIEFKVDAGTGNLIVNVATIEGGRFGS